MGDDGPDYLVCPYAFWCAPARPSKGRRCHDCPTVVWVSELLVPLVDGGELIALCHGCAEKRKDTEGDVVFGGVHPRQIEEAKGDAARIARQDQFAARWREHFKR